MINYKSDKINEAIIISIIISFVVFTASNLFLYQKYIDSESHGVEFSFDEGYYNSIDATFYSSLAINSKFEYSKPYLLNIEYHFSNGHTNYYIFAGTLGIESKEQIELNHYLGDSPSKIIYNLVGFDNNIYLVKNL